MGNDGGSIPKRSEVVKQEKRKQKLEKASEKDASTCALTKEPLSAPIVVCKRGLFYNKESLLKAMLDKTLPKEFRHIKKISQDLINLNDDACFDPCLS